tara:strand:- start:314 stop:1189 length:876 start_codon:yes stop_codon:yes gene_type:complete
MKSGRFLANFLLLPSFLCLDAALAAVAWSLCIALDSRGGDLSLLIEGPSKFGVLFFGVWSVYLADRIRDTFATSSGPGAPLRYQFAGRNRPALTVICLVAATLAATFLISIQELAFWVAGSVIALLTLGYFVGLRASWNPERKRARFPLKETCIASCFAAGVILCSGDIAISIPVAALFTALSLLFLSNCLLISLVESNFDEEFDHRAFFAGRKGSAAWIAIPTVLAIGFAAGLLIRGEFRFTSFSIFGGGGLTLLIFLSRAKLPRLTQALADGVLLFPWIAIGVGLFFGD